MSTRLGKVLPVLGGALFLLYGTRAVADQILAPTVSEQEEKAAPEEAPEKQIAAVPPLQYVDQTFDGLKGWFSKRGSALMMNSRLNSFAPASRVRRTSVLTAPL